MKKVRIETFQSFLSLFVEEWEKKESDIAEACVCMSVCMCVCVCV
jgi:hypothetical protein